MGSEVSTPDSTMKGGRSYAAAAKKSVLRDEDRGRPASKSNGDGTVRSEAASNPASPLWTQVREVERQLAKQEKNEKLAQAQWKRESDCQLREAHAAAAGLQKELDEVQTQLEHQRQLRARANVVLKAKDQELKAALADRDRLQAVVDERNAARLLAGGINIQAACPTLPEIEAHIRRALTVTVSEWIEEMPPALSSAVSVPWFLSQVFIECFWVVRRRMDMHTEFMNGGVGQEDRAGTTDEATVDMFRQHIRRHHRTLFPLTGEQLRRACHEVVSTLGCSLAPSFPTRSADMVARSLMQTKLDRVVAEYLPIIVGTVLQNPTAKFSNYCGTEQPFDSNIHAESIDGDAVSTGQPCLVVFPSLLVEREGGHGFQPLSKHYILPVAKS